MDKHPEPTLDGHLVPERHAAESGQMSSEGKLEEFRSIGATKPDDESPLARHTNVKRI